METVPENIPEVVGLNATSIEASEAEKVAGPEKPTEYVTVPERSPVPVFVIDTACEVV
jgi:hypothetical protein